MKKSFKSLVSLTFGCLALASMPAYAVEKAPEPEQTTRNDAVIFKVHDITPVTQDGVVTGCDYTVTLYNRTAVNFRSFTINMQWNDVVDERFKFDRYMASIMSADEFASQKDLIGEDTPAEPLKTAITVNAFGADKQISIHSHVDTEKCYLMLSDASYTISPCDIARNIDNNGGKALNNKECSQMFQFVSIANPEYFGQFKKLSATDLAAQDKALELNELSDIDTVINKIVENLGTSDKTLHNIN